MPPVPCSHCGTNFMRSSIDPEVPKLCNNCLIKEKRRNGSVDEECKNISISIEIPQKIENEIEEFCMREGLTFHEFFMKIIEIQLKKNLTESFSNVFETEKDLAECVEKMNFKKNKGAKK